MPLLAETVTVDSRLSCLLLGIAFSSILRKRGDEKSAPTTRMHQVRRLLHQIPALLVQLAKPRRELSLELTRLLRQGPDKYITSALRELPDLVK